MTLASDDPFARFRTSMAASHTDSPTNPMGSPEITSSTGLYPREAPFPPPISDESKDRDEDDALLRLVEEATAATEDGPSGGGGGGFTVTATSSATVIPGTSYGLYSAAASLTSGPFAAAPPPPPPPPPVSPPSFAETMAAHHPATPAAAPAAAHQSGMSPLVYHAPTPTTPATPATQAAGQSAAESMIVRTHKGVFLLQPAAGGATRTSQSPCGQGQSPPVSPLPSYALPPALPPATTGGGSFALGASVGYAQQKKAGLSPPQYAAPPPYWKH